MTTSFGTVVASRQANDAYYLLLSHANSESRVVLFSYSRTWTQEPRAEAHYHRHSEHSKK